MSNTRVFVAGHKGMVGSAILRKLITNSNLEVLTVSKNELDLVNSGAVAQWFKENPVDQVIIAAAKVGGIYANNTYPAEFIYQNLMIEANLIHSAFIHGVKKLLFLGSSCIYPKNAPQPMKEEALLSGPLEPTNEPYAIAKISGIKLCESYNRQYGTDYRSIMPTNLYGPQDNFHPENSHVLPALIHRFHQATTSNDPEVVVWGTGKPRREFLHVDDLASAAIHTLNLPKEVYWNAVQPMRSHINVGTGEDVSIKKLSFLIAKTTGFTGKIFFDTSKPDGTVRKLLDVSKLSKLGWTYKIKLEEGIHRTYQWYCDNLQSLRI